MKESVRTMVDDLCSTPEGNAAFEREMVALHSEIQRRRKIREAGLMHRVVCPNCGEVDVVPDGYEHGVPIVGQCPSCDDTLFFAPSELQGEA